MRVSELCPFSSNDVLALEIQAANTQWEAGTPSRSAFTGYVDGFQWAIVRNVITHVLHWDLVGIVTFPVRIVQLMIGNASPDRARWGDLSRFQ
jgi:hypothetical protein